MPFYCYIAKSFKGEEISDEREAKNEKELAKILRQEGFILISATSRKKPLTKIWRGTFPFSGRVSLKEKIMFTGNLKVMISAGVSLPRALNTLSWQSKNKKFKKVLLEIREDVLKGKSFSKGIKKFPNIFSDFYYHLIKIGEESGTLEKSLENLTSQMEKDYELKSNIKAALIYPAVIVIAGIGIAILMLLVVIPKMALTFEELNIEFPFTTQLIIGAALFLTERWYLLIFLAIILIFLAGWMIKTKTGKKMISWLSLKIPIVSPIVKKSNSAYAIRALSTLTKAGIPVLQSLNIISQSLGNFYFKKSLIKAGRKVEEGQKISEGLRDFSDLYGPMVLQMLKVGEETGESTAILEKTAVFLETEVTKTTKNLSSVIEPILILIIGAAVGFLAVSIIQPIYQMYGAI